MNTSELVAQIDGLPLQEKYYVLEKIVQSLKKSEEHQVLKVAANELYSDYAANKELTVFTLIDCEDFYETR
jgi:hypothetical protein